MGNVDEQRPLHGDVIIRDERSVRLDHKTYYASFSIIMTTTDLDIVPRSGREHARRGAHWMGNN